MDRFDLEEDFNDFVDREEVEPRDLLTARVQSHVHADMNPRKAVVFSKLVGIQGFVGILTMLFCPQFSLSFTNNHEVFHYFHHRFGESICMAICGSIFIGSGALFASYILRYNELEVIRKSRVLSYTMMSSVALAVFILAGAEVYIQLGLFWFAGATLSGVALLEVNSRIRLGLGLQT